MQSHTRLQSDKKPAREPLPGRALVFTYRRLNRFLHALADRSLEGPHTFCSSWPGLEPINLQENFNRYYRGGRLNTALSDEDYHQIISRSCVLRLLPASQAHQMVSAMYRVLDEVVDRASPDYHISVTVDNYMTDLLCRLCSARGAKLINLAASCVPNSILVTAYGEHNLVRQPSEQEVESALTAFLDDNQLITYGYETRYSFRRHLKIWLTWWAKCAYFRLAGWLRNDPLNFRYLMGSLPARDGNSSLWSYRCIHYVDQDWRERLGRASKPALFFPLSYTPEASTSYWLRDLRYIDYEHFVLQACRSLCEHYQLVVKEHWSCQGARRWPFYEKLKSIPGIILVPAGVPSRLVMAQVERVLTGAGMTPLEAALRGKKVATLDKPYYYVDGFFANLGSADQVASLPQILESFEPPPPTHANRRLLVERVLQCTLQGHFIADSRLDSEANYETASQSLIDYLRTV